MASARTFTTYSAEGRHRHCEPAARSSRELVSLLCCPEGGLSLPLHSRHHLPLSLPLPRSPPVSPLSLYHSLDLHLSPLSLYHSLDPHLYIHLPSPPLPYLPLHPTLSTILPFFLYLRLSLPPTLIFSLYHLPSLTFPLLVSSLPSPTFLLLMFVPH